MIYAGNPKTLSSKTVYVPSTHSHNSRSLIILGVCMSTTIKQVRFFKTLQKDVTNCLDLQNFVNTVAIDLAP